jgi:transcriptional regulator with XRE-family HTH domain
MPIRHNYSALVKTILSKEIGNLLTKVQENSGLSQTEVTERIGLFSKSFAYIYLLESGKIKIHL